MKKLLLSLALMGAVLLGNAQVLLNELYTNPGNGNSEFFELYNSSIDPTAVNLNCYTLVSYYNNGTTKGFYVLDFPDVSIASRSFLVGAADSTFDVQKAKGVKPNFSWNPSKLEAFGGSIIKYTLNSTGTGYLTPTTLTVSERADFFLRGAVSSEPDYAVFLFDNGTYVNGILGKFSSSSVPNSIRNMPALNLNNTCGPYSISWLNVKVAEFVGKADGSDNGYIRYGEGLCGAWDKANSAHTPGTTNGAISISTNSGGITTSESIICNTKVAFKLTATTDAGSFPVKVSLYYDIAPLGVLNTGDEFKEFIMVSEPSNTEYSFTIPADQKVLLVYQTTLGCFSKVVAPTNASTSLTTIEKNICGSKVDFSISAASPDISTFALPLTVQLYHDNGTKGAYDKDVDVAIGTSVAITSIPASTQSINIPAEFKTEDILLVYSSDNYSCFITKAVKPVPATGSITTSEVNICGNRVNFQITGASGDALAYALPIQAQLYYDHLTEGMLGVYDVGIDLPVQAPISVSSFSATTYSFTNIDPSKRVVLVYSAAASCLGSKTVMPRNAAGSINTTQKSFCGNRVDFQVLSGTGDATAAFALPVRVNIYYDLNNDNVLDENEKVVKAFRDVTSFSTTVLSLNVPDAGQKIILEYVPAQACFGKTAIPTIAVGNIITTEKVFCGKRIEFQVNATNGDATVSTASPVMITLHYDANANGVADTDEPAQASRSVTSASSTIYYFYPADATQKMLIKYSGAQTCLINKTIVPTPTTDFVEINVGGNFDNCTVSADGQRKANYFVVNASTNSAAYPLTLQLFEDKNRNGQIDVSEATAIGTQNISTAPSQPSTTANTVYSVLLSNPESFIIVKATSDRGCSEKVFVVDNSCAPLQVLPVTYASFTATRSSSSQVVLEWETAMEENNRGFHVQRLVNGEWKNIGFVFTAADRGNSSSNLKYSFKDANSSKGISQYRILQVDMDGKGRYSEVRSIRGEEMAARLTVFPNPSNTGTFSILFEDGSSVRDVVVSDVSGRAVKQFKGVSNSSLTIENLGAGFYTVQVRNRTTGAMATEKVIIKKR